MSILSKIFKRRVKGEKEKIVYRLLQPLTSYELSKVYKLITCEDFQYFLQYLDLTAEEKLRMFSSMNLLDSSKLNEAIKMQYTMAGLSSVRSIVDGLIIEFKEKEQDEKDKEKK